MSKLILLFCFLSLACLSQACNVTYYGADPPKVCDGDLCFMLNAPATHVTLDSVLSSIQRSNFNVNEILLDATCKCTLYLYTKPNFTGYTFSFKYLYAKAKQIFPNRLWRSKNNSFKLKCTF